MKVFQLTSLRSKRVFVQNNQAYEEFEQLCGPYVLGLKSEALKENRLLDYYKKPSNLKLVVKDIDILCFYYVLYQSLLPTTSDNKIFVDIEAFLHRALGSFGVVGFEDFSLLEKEDFFEQKFLLEFSTLQKQYPILLSEPGGKYQMEYDLKRREAYFCQIKGSKSPSSLILKKFSKFKMLLEV